MSWFIDMSDLVCTIGVYCVDQIPILVLHVLKADITKDTSVIDENINATKVLDSRVNDGIALLNAIVVGNSLAPSGSDLVDYSICSLKASSVSVNN